MEQISELLLRLGITANYRGYAYCIDAVMLVMEDISRLTLVTKELYPRVATLHRTEVHCVERNIRTVVKLCWRQNQCLLKELSGGSLFREPTASQFLAILAYHCANNGKEQFPFFNKS